MLLADLGDMLKTKPPNLDSKLDVMDAVLHIRLPQRFRGRGCDWNLGRSRNICWESTGTDGRRVCRGVTPLCGPASHVRQLGNGYHDHRVVTGFPYTLPWQVPAIYPTLWQPARILLSHTKCRASRELCCRRNGSWPLSHADHCRIVAVCFLSA